MSLDDGIDHGGIGKEVQEAEKRRLAEIEKRVMDAFEKVKPRMCQEAREETQRYLAIRRWITEDKPPSKHPCYMRIKGAGHKGQPANFFYPDLLILQAIWPDNSTVSRISTTFAKYRGRLEIEDGPEHYPMLGDTKTELALFRGATILSPMDWKLCDICYKRASKARLNKAWCDAGLEQGDTTEEDGNHDQNIASNNLDQMETAAEKRVKDSVAVLEDAKKDLREVQEKKRDSYKTEFEFWKKTLEASKKRAALQAVMVDRYARKLSDYDNRLGESTNSSTETPLPPGEQESGDGRPVKRLRLTVDKTSQNQG